MARYIDAEKFKQQLESAMKKMHLIGGVKGVDAGAVIKAIDMQPAADVVPIVRCKNCCFSAQHPTSDEWKICTNEQWNTEYYPLVCDNDFCSYGRRKDEISKATDS